MPSGKVGDFCSRLFFSVLLIIFDFFLYALAEPKQIHPAPPRADKTERGEDYRNVGILPYYLISGKAFYKESDIQRMLQKAYQPLFDNRNLV